MIIFHEGFQQEEMFTLSIEWWVIHQGKKVQGVDVREVKLKRSFWGKEKCLKALFSAYGRKSFGLLIQEMDKCTLEGKGSYAYVLR
jgi:hypothetical protein